jgi:hypothetical protein
VNNSQVFTVSLAWLFLGVQVAGAICPSEAKNETYGVPAGIMAGELRDEDRSSGSSQCVRPADPLFHSLIARVIPIFNEH